MSQLHQKLSDVLAEEGVANTSSTPDYIMAHFLEDVIRAFTTALSLRAIHSAGAFTLPEREITVSEAYFALGYMSAELQELHKVESCRISDTFFKGIECARKRGQQTP